MSYNTTKHRYFCNFAAEMSCLNKENIARSTGEVEYHPLKPFLPAEAKVLFLGSFPPQRKRWCVDFFYPNFINDHWRIEGQVFFGDRNHFVLEGEKRFKLDEIVRPCEEKGLAFFDTARAVRRLKDNASDKFLEVIEPTDIRLLLKQLPQCQAIVTTGQKATDIIRSQIEVNEPSVGQNCPFEFEDRILQLYRMPSSSRAYPLALEKKAAVYRLMLNELGLLKE